MNSPMAFPDDENGEMLGLMASHGDDLSLPRDIDFEHIFPTLESALAFMSEIANHTDAFKLSWYDAESSWNVCVIRHMVPTHHDITECESSLDRIAQAHGGRADGWGCIQASANDS